MKYARPAGKRTQEKRARMPKRPELPFTIEKKMIHGQLVGVKVYAPAWAEKPSTTTHFHHSEKSGASLETAEKRSRAKYPGRTWDG